MTLIFYEAPHRILETLEAIEQAMGARPVVVARELTKVHEEFLRGTAAEIRALLAARDAVKGEITILIGKPAAPVPDDTPLPEAVEGDSAYGRDQGGRAAPGPFEKGSVRRIVAREVAQAFVPAPLQAESASRQALRISTAPGVSPCTQIVCAFPSRARRSA